MKRIALNFAASSLVLGVTTVGCMMNGVGTGAAVAQSQARNDQQSARLHQQAQRAIASGNLSEATSALEEAVALSPRDAGYRLLLADAYMKAGRFRSAEATYRDVLSLDPSRTRAALSLALMQVANGQSQDALSQLERIEEQASAADLGLAYALAGSPQRAVDILEPAARAPGATARVRQNLALAYAFGGDWQRARMVASQDVSPSELADRMAQWASLASRSGSPTQVAALLNVSPVQDPGQPIRLALSRPAPTQAPVALAAAEPVPVPVARPQTIKSAAEVPMPVQYAAPAPAPVVQVPAAAPALVQSVAFAAAAAPAEVVVPAVAPIIQAPAAAPAPTQSVAFAAPAPAPAATEFAELEQAEPAPAQQEAQSAPVPARTQMAEAAAAMIRPDPVIMPVTNRAARSVAPVAARIARAIPAQARRSASGRYVVQIGAFSSAANAERAWQQYERSYGLRAEQPVTMTIDMNGRLLHRVAVSGFAKRDEATQLCTTIKSRGGACFVRGQAGDSANGWASRYTRNG